MTEGYVSVIVVNWNGKEYLGPCLSSLLTQTYPSYEVILVDNGSTDGSIAYVQERFPQVKVIANGTNIGFAGGNNVAIKVTSGEYVATVNNDTVAHPRWLDELMRGAQSEPSVGMVASKILFHHRRDVIDSAGIAVDKAGIGWNLRHGERDNGQSEEPAEVFGACAAAALYRRAMLNEVGLFDEDFFAYYEDVDLAWRARLRGWRCLYNPRAIVYHVHSATGGEGPSKNRLLGRNKVWTIVKNYPSPHVLLFLPLILLYDWAAIWYTLSRGDVSAVEGRLAALRLLPKMLRKRTEIQKKRIPWAVFPLSTPPSPLVALSRHRRSQVFRRAH